MKHSKHLKRINVNTRKNNEAEPLPHIMKKDQLKMNKEIKPYKSLSKTKKRIFTTLNLSAKSLDSILKE